MVRQAQNKPQDDASRQAAERRDAFGNVNTQQTQVLAQLLQYLNQQDKDTGRQQNSFTQLTGSTDNLAKAINPLTSSLSLMPQMFQTHSAAIATNSQQIEQLNLFIQKLITSQDKNTQQLAAKAENTEKTEPPNTTNNVTINQTVNVSDKSNLTPITDATTAGVKTGIGNGA
jgi:hypothetical protein